MQTYTLEDGFHQFRLNQNHTSTSFLVIWIPKQSPKSPPSCMSKHLLISFTICSNSLSCYQNWAIYMYNQYTLVLLDHAFFLVFLLAFQYVYATYLEKYASRIILLDKIRSRMFSYDLCWCLFTRVPFQYSISFECTKFSTGSDRFYKICFFLRVGRWLHIFL